MGKKEKVQRQNPKKRKANQFKYKLQKKLKKQFKDQL
jgi:hypothetical protein